MHADIFSAISADGYLATLEGNSDWTDDDDVFARVTQEYGCIVLGHTTFEQYKDEVYPLSGVQHLVLTRRELDVSSYDNVRTVQSVRAALEAAKDLGFQRVLVVGGSMTNESFMNEGVVRKLILDVHPILLGQGLRLLGNHQLTHRLRLVHTSRHDSFIQIAYELIAEEA